MPWNAADAVDDGAEANDEPEPNNGRPWPEWFAFGHGFILATPIAHAATLGGISALPMLIPPCEDRQSFSRSSLNRPICSGSPWPVADCSSSAAHLAT